MIIGERLAELRRDKGLTQKQLAKQLNVSLKSVEGYEREKNSPSDETKIAIAKFFDVSLDYLMGLTDIQFTYDISKVIRIPREFPKDEIPLLSEIVGTIIRSKLKK